jgi:hypothetical protein
VSLVPFYCVRISIFVRLMILGNRNMGSIKTGRKLQKINDRVGF